MKFGSFSKKKGLGMRRIIAAIMLMSFMHVTGMEQIKGQITRAINESNLAEIERILGTKSANDLGELFNDGSLVYDALRAGDIDILRYIIASIDNKKVGVLRKTLKNKNKLLTSAIASGNLETVYEVMRLRGVYRLLGLKDPLFSNERLFAEWPNAGILVQALEEGPRTSSKTQATSIFGSSGRDANLYSYLESHPSIKLTQPTFDDITKNMYEKRILPRWPQNDGERAQDELNKHILLGNIPNVQNLLKRYAQNPALYAALLWHDDRDYERDPLHLAINTANEEMVRLMYDAIKSAQISLQRPTMLKQIVSKIDKTFKGNALIIEAIDSDEIEIVYLALQILAENDLLDKSLLSFAIKYCEDDEADDAIQKLLINAYLVSEESPNELKDKIMKRSIGYSMSKAAYKQSKATILQGVQGSGQ